MTTLDVRALLDAPHWPADRRLDAILRSMLNRRDVPLPAVPPDPATLWPAFAELPVDVLRTCAADRLTEALMVEKLGLACCAKMTLLAATVEERMLYSMMAADEATHFFWISRFLDRPAAISPFLQLLADTIESGTGAMLTFLVQVVLEGWGVEHYRELARDCSDPMLREVLRRVVTDEVRHHESGVRLVRGRVLTPDEERRTVDLLERLLSMVRCGPQSVVAAIAPRTLEEAVYWFENLDAKNSSARKLALLRSLIEESGVASIAETLERRGAFAAMTAAECAELCSIS